MSLAPSVSHAYQRKKTQSNQTNQIIKNKKVIVFIVPGITISEKKWIACKMSQPSQEWN